MKRELFLVAGCAVLACCGEAVTQEDNEVPEKSVPVTSTQPVQRDIDYVLSALGSVESIDDPTISAETSGQITRLHVAEGDTVEPGELLLEIDNTLHQIEAEKSEAELERQQVVIANQRREVARLERLAKTLAVSADHLEDQQDHLQMLLAQRDVAQKQWELARHLDAKTRVQAPQRGMIARRHVSVGDFVEPGQSLFDMVSIQRLRARLSFPERDAARIEIGQPVRLSSPAAPDAVAIGAVTSINPRINPHNRTFEITVAFDNPGGWYPGASVDATLLVARNQAALTVPSLSVVKREGREYVFVVRDGRALAQAVELGWREDQWVEIRDGVQAADRVVVQGALLITDGSLLSEADNGQ